MSHGAEDLGGGRRTSGGGGGGGGRLDELSQSQEQSRHQNCCKRYLAQWEGMLLKKLLYVYAKKWMFLVILLLPILGYMYTLIPGTSEIPMDVRLPLTLADYNDDVKVILQSTSDTGPMQDIANAYEELAQQHCTVERISQNVMDYTDPEQDSPGKMYEIRKNLIAAATFDQEMIAWSRVDMFLHSAPLSLNLVCNAMAKATVGPEASIEVTNAPYKRSYEKAQGGKKQGLTPLKAIVLSVFVMIYLSIVLGILSILVVQEKVTQIRMQQQVSGVNMATYWLTHYITDLVLYFAFSLVVILVVHGLCDSGEMLAILMLIGMAALPFTYIMAGLLSNLGSPLVMIVVVNIIFGVFFVPISPLLEYAFPSYYKWMMMIFYLYPVFTGSHAVVNSFLRFIYCHPPPIKIEEYQDYFSSKCTPGKTLFTPYCRCRNILDWVEVRYLLITAIIYLLWLIFGEHSTTLWYGVKYIICRCKGNATIDDEDVAAAAEGISKMSREDRKEHALVVNRVSKIYCGMTAVRGISFSVKPGECFGLLGANGAGKTTTFKMIVGDTSMTKGSIHVRGCSLKSSRTAARHHMGYCPQHDTLFDFCTGRQTLRIFLLLRGTRRNLVREASEKLASDYGFFAHLDNKVKDYSGGTKRKLNAAVAGEGSSLICLDEPSSGVDPASRRHVWNVLSSLRDNGKAVLLTSHSMEEVEALCTQLAIMVDGQIHCLGSQQRIKNKFAQCLVLKLHVETNPESMADTLQKIRNQMESKYPTASLEEEFGGRLTYHIPVDKLRWSRVFSHVERHRSDWRVADYSLTQLTLEDVFLDIAKENSDEKKNRREERRNRQPRKPAAANEDSRKPEPDDNDPATRGSNVTIYDEENGRVTRGTNT